MFIASSYQQRCPCYYSRDALVTTTGKEGEETEEGRESPGGKDGRPPLYSWHQGSRLKGQAPIPDLAGRQKDLRPEIW